ncbi:carboxylating nicotinate-nucleotide diphosphorylase [Corynebacterium hansenii]|uniref:nicotinate-nucleotide diphosphorylase (carboxylating) n=1 Tax=Corynebacterium hansenii TaxID=394964 RepID=A0ABV7ZNH2_9CORY|nr:carboxylating nicotinate-nucleotide diphosphorylase [Corynebacterium hansenii]WJZ00233.1 Nicotinate-nucleotide pyrophosphorylase [carboxylating] [Corynebacterium hansenii]
MLDEQITRGLIRTALQEDLRYGPDVTSLATVGPAQRSRATVASRAEGVIAAGDAIRWTLEEVIADEFEVEILVEDGGRVSPGTVVAEIEAPTRGLLTAERTLLNIVTHASGIASHTRRWVDAVEGTGTRIRDSRKTIPGLRNLQKYAVTCGGGVNHRNGLGDEALIKDNHVAAAGGVVPALERVRRAYPELKCEIEVDDLTQLDQVLEMKPELVMLDNFEVWQTQIAVQRRAQVSPATQLESSGGLTLDVAREYASCGVDFLAVGALTHSSGVLDLGLDF